jgi:hypothetical protein
VKFAYNLLFHKRDPRVELPVHAIVKGAEVITRQIVLKVEWIKVIREATDLESQLCAIVLEFPD